MFNTRGIDSATERGACFGSILNMSPVGKQSNGEVGGNLIKAKATLLLSKMPPQGD